MNQEDIGRPIEILLVEDNPGDARWIADILRDGRLRNKLTVVTDGEEAADYLRRQGKYAGAKTPDLVLLDLNLPKKSGRELLEEMKADRNLSRIPVVVLTASQSEEDILRTYDLRAQGYLTKPLSMERLLQVIQTIEDFGLAIVKRDKP
ncbi:MAG: response regulator [Verrucomicrobiae bacterium]|nr:response regulator [Verrucomicrobiae bacterium]